MRARCFPCRPTPFAVLLLLAAAATAPSAHAQAPTAADSAARYVTLVGVVRDTAGRPLAGAEVRAGATQITLSDADGTFLLTGVEPDTVQLLVRRIGYRPADVVLAASAGLRVELLVRMVPAAVELGTITIEGRTMDTRLWQSGFYDRQKVGSGTFFDPEFLARHRGTMDGLMRDAPGVRVQRDRYGRTVALGRFGSGWCQLNVFIDGVFVRWASDIGIDQLLNKADVLAVEIYPRGTQVPATLAGYTASGGGVLTSPGGAGGGATGGTDCGVVAFWTKPIGGKADR